MKRNGFIYIMTNHYNQVLYVGVTSNLSIRINEHRTFAISKCFTNKYNCTKLVYYNKVFGNIGAAHIEEKRLKGGSRKQKIDLINYMNPEWTDLWENIKGW